MLRPLAIQEALDAVLERQTAPADTALIVLSDSGSIYAQAHRRRGKEAKDVLASGSAEPANRKKAPGFQGRSAWRAPQTEIQRLQLHHQPGLSSLMASGATSQAVAGDAPTQSCTAASLDAADDDSMLLCLTHDERARVLAGVACQSWVEEMARVRRLRSNVNGRFPASASHVVSGVGSSVGRSLSGGSSQQGASLRGGLLNRSITTKATDSGDASKVGAGIGMTVTANSMPSGNDDESEEVEAPVAIVGSQMASSVGDPTVAPLMLEGELGALLVMPLPIQGTNAVTSASAASLGLAAGAPLLLVLGAYPTPGIQKAGAQTDEAVSHSKERATDASASSLPLQGSSILSQKEWNELHDCAQSFAAFVAPALRKAFGATHEHDHDDAGDGLGRVAGGTLSGAAGKSVPRRGRAAGGGGAGGNTTATVFSDDRESAASVAGGQALQDQSGMSF